MSLQLMINMRRNAWIGAVLRGVDSFTLMVCGTRAYHCGNYKTNTKNLRTPLMNSFFAINITYDHVDDVQATLKICDRCVSTRLISNNNLLMLCSLGLTLP